MEFNSQICTTKEQSKRLLALGLKKETADCIITEKVDGTFDIFNINCGLLEVEIIKDASKFFVSSSAWSLHRLIEILDIWYLNLDFHNFDNAYEQVISYFEERVKGGFINKEYLE